MTWVLLIVFTHGQSIAATSAEFADREACVEAVGAFRAAKAVTFLGQDLKQAGTRMDVTYVCVRKKTATNK